MTMMNQQVKLKSDVMLEVGITIGELATALRHGIYYYSFYDNKIRHYQVRSIVLTGVQVIHRSGSKTNVDFVAAFDGYKKV